MSSIGRPELGASESASMNGLPVVTMAKPITDAATQERERWYGKILIRAFEDESVRPALGLAIARHESNFNAKAMNNTGSDARRGGSFGLCQMSMLTARHLGYQGEFEGLLQPKVNAKLAAKLCAENQLRVPISTVRDENNVKWAFNMASMYNSGHMYADCPRSTREMYCPKVVSYFLYYQHVLDLAETLRG